jgi:hypothetical protein
VCDVVVCGRRSTTCSRTAILRERLNLQSICLRSSFFVQQTTALQAHFFSGYKTQVVPPPPVHGYSGFGHATCEAADVQFFAAPVVFAPPEPVFSGFGRSTEQMGGSPSIMSAPGAARARPSAPASFASYISSL